MQRLKLLLVEYLHESLLPRIPIDSAFCYGKPRIRGLRYPIETKLEFLSSGMTIDDILAYYEVLP